MLVQASSACTVAMLGSCFNFTDRRHAQRTLHEFTFLVVLCAGSKVKFAIEAIQCNLGTDKSLHGIGFC